MSNCFFLLKIDSSHVTTAEWTETNGFERKHLKNKNRIFDYEKNLFFQCLVPSQSLSTSPVSNRIAYVAQM